MGMFDFILIVALIFFVYKGIRRGFFEDLLGFTGWLITILLALAVGDVVAGKLYQRFPALGTIVYGIAYFLVILGTRIGLTIFVGFLQRLFKEPLQQRFNSILGAGIGFFKGLFFISVLALAFSVLPVSPRLHALAADSSLTPHVKKFSVAIVLTVARRVPKTRQIVESIMNRFDIAPPAAESAAGEPQAIPSAQARFETSAQSDEGLTEAEIRRILEDDKRRLERIEQDIRR